MLIHSILLFLAQEYPHGECHKEMPAVMWPSSCSSLPCLEVRGLGIFPLPGCHQIVLTRGGEIGNAEI